MIAQFAMYDWPEERARLDRLWDAVRDALAAEGLAAPPALDRATPLADSWESAGLLVGQTCGLPYRTRLHDRVTLLGAFDYGLPGAPAGHYYSVLVVPAGSRARDVADLGRPRLAVNGFDSQSGWAALANDWPDLSFAGILGTGAHLASARAVAGGRADLAALDAVCWRLLGLHYPALAGRLRVIARTAPTPGLPLVTARREHAEAIARAITAALDALDAPRDGALPAGFVRLPPAAYLGIPTPPPPEGAPQPA